MRLNFVPIWILTAFSTLANTAHKDRPSTRAFSYNNESFLLHGKPYQIRGGQMDPQRIHPAYWRDRLFKAKALGLNTIFTYVFWDLVEPQEGHFDFEGRNNIASYFRQAQEEGLNVVLRAGPYADAERDWGGLPAWLLEVPNLQVRCWWSRIIEDLLMTHQVRTYNQPFLEASKNYIHRLAEEVKQLQVTYGGPILMVQVENEYGSYGTDHKYTAALRNIFQANFDVPLFTDGKHPVGYNFDLKHWLTIIPNAFRRRRRIVP